MTTKVYYGVPILTDEMTLSSLHKLLKANPNARLFVNKVGNDIMCIKRVNNVTYTIDHVGFFIGYPQPECYEYQFDFEDLLGSSIKYLSTFELTINEYNEYTSIRQVDVVYDCETLNSDGWPTWSVKSIKDV